MTAKTKSELSSKKKIIFSGILILIPIIFLLIFEGFLNLINYGEDYDMFIDHNFYGQEYRQVAPDYGKKYFHSLPYTEPNLDLFKKEKKENTFRIFVIGSSTAYGFPYGPGVMFSRILDQRLKDTYPDKDIEVVNIAITAINSFTFYDKIDQILDEEPDALLIYAGHNEFYGGLGIASREAIGQIRGVKLLHLKLLEFKTYQLIRSIVFGVGNMFSGSDEEMAASATLMERIVENKAIEMNSPVYQKAHEHYQKNMEAILRKAGKKDIPVFYSTMISNVRDLPPFASLEEGNLPAADKIYQEARALEEAEKYSEAAGKYTLAKDLDGIRFRASEDLNNIIRELAEEYEATLVNMKEAFESHSPYGLVGDNLLTEHVHPNIEGYFIMADAFYNTITNSEIIGSPAPPENNTWQHYRSIWGYSPLDSAYADIMIHKLKGGWPFQKDSTVNNFMHTYKPSSALDSVAYKAVRYDDISLEAAHKTMAKYYLVRNQPGKAVEEYRSILQSNPYYYENYIEAGDILFENEAYAEATDFYKQSLALKRDLYAISRLGEAYYQLGEYGPAVSYLEEVQKKDPEFRKVKVTTTLYDAYNKSDNTAQAQKLLSANKDIFAADEIPERKEVVVRVPAEVRAKIQTAIKLLQSGATESAYNLLMEANSIHETPIAHRFLGDILLVRKDPKALQHLKKIFLEYENDPEYLNTLVYASIIFRDFKYAQSVLPKLKQMSPGNPNISEYERVLRERAQAN